jgi:transcriptional regulator with XRE-family HTH domain
MFFENFNEICMQRNTTPYEVAMSLGLNKNTPSNWKKNGTIPKEEVLKDLAEHLNCEISDFFHSGGGSVFQNGITNIYNTTNGNNNESENITSNVDVLTTEEKDILSIYRRCNKRQKAKFLIRVYDFEEDEGL